MKNLDERVDDLELRLKRLEPALVPDLADILRSYPGGMTKLALDSGYHRESIYNFGVAKRTTKFPHKRAAAVARSFGDRRSFGRKLTIELLRRAWLVKRDQSEASIGCGNIQPRQRTDT